MQDQLSLELDELLATEFDWISTESSENDFDEKLARHMQIHDELSKITSSADTQYEDRCEQLAAEVAKWKSIAANRQLQLQSLKSTIKRSMTRTGYEKRQIMEIYAV